MPRNASGVYSLPQSPFIAGTAILSASVNNNYSDIATALTQSLATTGVSTMTGQFKAAVGSVVAPSITFTTSLTTGFYLAGANQIGIAVGGVLSATINSDLSWSFISAVTFSGASTFGGLATFNGNLAINSAAITFSAGAKTAFWNGIDALYSITITIDGGGIVPTTGLKDFYEVPCNSTIVSARMFADQSGSAVIDVEKSTYAGFPPSSSICASAPPTLSAVQKSEDTTLTGWTTALSAGDILGFDLDSVTTCTRITLSLICRRESS